MQHHAVIGSRAIGVGGIAGIVDAETEAAESVFTQCASGICPGNIDRLRHVLLDLQGCLYRFRRSRYAQGLAPFKTIAAENGVNFTAGLSVVRTSPAHGVGYDIAGKDLASEGSFRAAVYLAEDVFRNRQFYDRITANPLQKFEVDRGGRDMSVKDLPEEPENE